MKELKELHIQGDVALHSTELPKAAKNIKNRPLALGEVSGHAHVIEGDAELFEIDGKTYVVVGSDGATLRHVKLKSKEKADHNDIILTPNTAYEVILQNEYNPESEAFERVLD